MSRGVLRRTRKCTRKWRIPPMVNRVPIRSALRSPRTWRGRDESLMQLAMQGQSFFIYTGDRGAFPTFGNRIATSYVTYVGGTSLTMSGNGLSWSNEVVWQQGPEGAAPVAEEFQRLPNSFYQQGINMSMNQGSTQWRNVPDVSMCRKISRYSIRLCHQRSFAMLHRQWHWRHKLFCSALGRVCRLGEPASRSHRHNPSV